MCTGVLRAAEEGSGGRVRDVRGAGGSLRQPRRTLLCKHKNSAAVTLAPLAPLPTPLFSLKIAYIEP